MEEESQEEVVGRVNREHKILKENAIKERGVQEKKLEKIKVRQQRNHELYEDSEISREEFLIHREELNRQLCELREKQTETSVTSFDFRDYNRPAPEH